MSNRAPPARRQKKRRKTVRGEKTVVGGRGVARVEKRHQVDDLVKVCTFGLVVFLVCLAVSGVGVVVTAR